MIQTLAGPHQSVAGNIAGRLYGAILQAQQPWIVPKNCLIQPPAALATVLRPDVIVLDEIALEQESLWKTEPIVCNGASIKLVTEVTSTNWQDDYARKVEEYVRLIGNSRVLVLLIFEASAACALLEIPSNRPLP